MENGTMNNVNTDNGVDSGQDAFLTAMQRAGEEQGASPRGNNEWHQLIDFEWLGVFAHLKDLFSS